MTIKVKFDNLTLTEETLNFWSSPKQCYKVVIDLTDRNGDKQSIVHYRPIGDEWGTAIAELIKGALSAAGHFN